MQENSIPVNIQNHFKMFLVKSCANVQK